MLVKQHIHSIFQVQATLDRMVTLLKNDIWKYSGPIFDSHTHIWNTTNLDQVMEVVDQLGIKSQIAITHLKEVRDAAAKRYPNRFVFAKYLPTRSIIPYRMKEVMREIEKMDAEGYSIAKMWAAPAWRNYVGNGNLDFTLTSSKLEPMFKKLEENGYTLLIHVADPDTYYATTYANTSYYGTKDVHLDELESLIRKYPNLQFQLAHFGAQPEIHRLPRLARWFETYSNIVVDTASSRWMARELSKDPKTARQFLIKHSKKILFGSDASLSRTNSVTESSEFTVAQSPYYVRYLAQRILWETKERQVPLPFPDDDTRDIGGTFINGLNLPKRVLRDIYWGNAQRLFGSLQ